MARRVGRLAALATAAALLASCTGDGTQTADVETAMPTDASAIETPGPSTTPTPQPPPSPGPSPSATATQPADGLVLAGDLLLASDEGVAVDRGGEPRTLTAIPARRAFHDGAGGVVFQGVAPPQPQAPSPAIMWLPPDGSDAVTVVADGAAERVALHDAAIIDGTPTAVYTASTGDQPQTAEETLRLLRLPDGPTQQVAVVGGWESGARSVSRGGELFGVYRFAEASTWFAFYGPDGEALELDVNPLPERDACVDDVSCPSFVAVSPDGDRLAWIEPGAVHLVDRAGGGDRTLPLPARENGVLYDSVAWADQTLVVNRIAVPEEPGGATTPAPSIRFDLTGPDPQPVIDERAAFASVVGADG